MKFRKLPVEVEAIQWTGDNTSEIIDWITASGSVAGWYDEGIFPECLAIPTLEGVMYASIGDWMIQGVKGEFYACKPDVFEMTYEPVRREIVSYPQ